jgi:predicted ATPase
VQRDIDININLAVRVGIHTGLVVVGKIGSEERHEQLALGETPNVAARMQGLADPNTVVISAHTYRLIQGFFDCQSLGTRKLKGISNPLTVFQVLNETDVQSRLEVASSFGLTPLVGKEKEVELLLSNWKQVAQGNGQVVLLNGEAGIGKSRLLRAFKARLADDPHLWMECRCWPYHQNSPLYPVIDLLTRLLAFRREDLCEVKTRKLEALLAQHDLPLAENMPVFSDLLSVPSGECYTLPKLNSQRLRQKTLEAYVMLLLKMAEQQPVIFVVEDLHWADDSTLELLNLLTDHQNNARLLTLLTSRPEFAPPWGKRPGFVTIMLNRLTQSQIEMMVTQVANGKILPPALVQQIILKTDGIPLFVEELTRMVLESPLLRMENDHYELSGQLLPLEIPATLYDSLMARLDRLAPVKKIAQIGATIGREFSHELIAEVTLPDFDESTLQQGLAKLVKAELLYQQTAPNNGTTYVFKHALIQDAAYESLLKSTRQLYHQRIAHALLQRFPETAELQPEILAYHFTKAESSEPDAKDAAVFYWIGAGQRALQHSANVEAIRHFNQGREVLRALPETPHRIQQELELLNSLGLALIAARGYTAPEVEETYRRARALCHRAEHVHHQSSTMLGLWKSAFTRVNLDEARRLADECMNMAQQKQDPAFLLTAHLTSGLTRFSLGEFVAARDHLEQARRYYDPVEYGTDAFVYGEDPGVVCLTYYAFTLWLLGYQTQARQYSEEALALARKLDHPFTLAFALNLNAGLSELCRETAILLARAEELIALAEEQGFPFWRDCGLIQKGSAMIELGNIAAGVALVDQGVEKLQAAGAEIGKTGGMAQRAFVYGKMGLVEEGLKMIAEARALVERGGERQDAAENLRIKGELLLRAVPDEQQAEAFFQQALGLARRQQAKSWELRAAISLARLLRKQSKRVEARALLAEIYNWFTEGFETADLREAKALLEELG